MDITEHVNEFGIKYWHCTLCDYKCYVKQYLKAHISTKKHNINLKSSNTVEFKCNVCNKIYKERTGLWKHSKTCSAIKEPELTNHFVYKSDQESSIEEFLRDKEHGSQIALSNEIVMELIKQNQEFKQLIIQQTNVMMEIAQKPSGTNKSHNNSNNNQFNLNFFLNEQCKDAMRLDEFVESLQINSETIEYNGMHGFVAGVNNIFSTGLKKLDQFKRPIHCTDLKREIMYVKDANGWSKDENNIKIIKAIERVVFKNTAHLIIWEQEDPELRIPDTRRYNAQFQIMREVIGGSGQQYELNMSKVFRNLAQEVLIDKKIKYDAII